MNSISDQQIAQYITDIQRSGGTDADIARAMDQFQVSPQRIAAALGTDVNTIQSRYNQASPSGTYSTSARSGGSSGMFSNIVNQVASGVREAEFNNQIANYIRDIQQQGGTDVDIARAMDQFGVDPARVASALNVDVGNIQSRYNRANPSGAYVTTNQQIADYIRGLQTQGKDNAFIAAEMDRFGVDPTRVASALNLSARDVQNLYNQVRPSGTFATSQTDTSTTGGGSNTTTTTTGGGTTGFTSQQIADYIRGLQAQGRDNAFIAAEMDRFGVNPSQVASALNLSLADVQALYNQVRPGGSFSTTQTNTTTGGTTTGTTTATPSAFDAAVIAALARPRYDNVRFTGRTGIGTITTPTTYEDLALLDRAAPGASRGVMGLAPVPAPEPYVGVPAAQARPATNMKEGGLAGLAERVQSAGRNGDTMLAHITPEEAGILQALGGSGTINPRTGLPEFWDPLRDLRRAGRSVEKNVRQVGRSIDRRITQPIIGELNNLAERLGPIGQIAATMIHPALGAVYAGFAAPGDDFNFKRAGTAYLLAELGQEMLPPGAPSGPYDYAPTGFNTGVPTPGPDAITLSDISTIPVSDTLNASQMDPRVLEGLPPDATAPSTTSTPTGQPAPVTDVMPTNVPPAPPESAANLAGSIYDIGKEGLGAFGIDTPMEYATTAIMANSIVQGQRERERYKEQEEAKRRLLAERRARYRQQAEGILNMYPIRFAAKGGMMDEPDSGPDYDFAAGGMPPRFLSGGGDGMSDSILATIGNQQPARLADGEFVIPADVVSGLGNGSSKAGAKQLYAMMDRIRQARTGTKKQGKEINPRQFMPA